MPPPSTDARQSYFNAPPPVFSASNYQKPADQPPQTLVKVRMSLRILWHVESVGVLIVFFSLPLVPDKQCYSDSYSIVIPFVICSLPGHHRGLCSPSAVVWQRGRRAGPPDHPAGLALIHRCSFFWQPVPSQSVFVFVDAQKRRRPTVVHGESTGEEDGSRFVNKLNFGKHRIIIIILLLFVIIRFDKGKRKGTDMMVTCVFDVYFFRRLSFAFVWWKSAVFSTTCLWNAIVECSSWRRAASPLE